MKVRVIPRLGADLRRQVAAGLSRTGPGRDLVAWWTHRRTKAFLLSYPKTGRTWLRLMIGKALDLEYGLAVQNPMEIQRMHRYRRAIPRIRVDHEDAYSTSWQAIESSKARYAGKTVIFMVRDPRDVLVSIYFELSKRRERYEGTLDDFIRQPVGSLDSIITYYNVWADNRHLPRRFCLVRYEDLHRDPAAALATVFEAIGLGVSTQTVAAAVEFGRFDNMRKLEMQDAFKSRRLRAADKADPTSFKTRKGRVGGYQAHLTPDQLAYVNERIAARLSPYYGSYLAEAPPVSP